MTAPGRKDDAEKLRWDLVPFGALSRVVEVLTYGARKYAVDNWKDVPDWSRRYFAAAMRHLVAWKRGEKIDEESGHPHLAHAVCCVLFLLWLDENTPAPVYAKKRPKVVCLCGSTRFGEAFAAANLRETLAGNIVLSVGCTTSSDAELGLDEATKVRLDDLHKRKIDLADEILVLNVGGYVGPSTRSEIEHARATGKPVRWLEEPKEAK